jgi:hypothetical protein
MLYLEREIKGFFGRMTVFTTIARMFCDSRIERVYG